MKHTMISMIALCLLAVYAPAQTKQEYKPRKGDYQVEQGHTLNKEYVDKILTKKMKQLQNYLAVLAEKKQPAYEMVIDRAMLLFNNDESRLITVTSKVTGKTVIKPVRAYLTDMSRLPYKSVKITYRNYTAINNIHRQPDGTYRGIAVFQQEFTGYDKEGQALYNDVVQRNVEVVIRLKEYIKDATHHNVTTDVFFGNMGVTEM